MPFLTTGEIAGAYRVSIPTVKRWIREGYLTASRTTGGHYRISKNEFQRFQTAHGLASPPRPEVRILIVDDEANLVDLLVEYLAGDPRAFKLETATDGYEALIKVGGFKPTILILDVLMPRLDGIEVCRRLKANPETRAIGILGITGHPDSIPALVDAGAQACLAKPLRLGELGRELDRLLASMES